MADIWPKMTKNILPKFFFSDLAQTWYIGSLGQVQWSIFFIWPKNEKWPRYGQKLAKILDEDKLSLIWLKLGMQVL